jgi:hypothetical protein
MILSKEYKEVLKHFNTLNSNMHFVKGNEQSTIIGSNKGPILFCKFTSDVEIPEEFSINNLGKILIILDMFEDFNIEVIGDKKLILSNEKKKVTAALTKSQFIQYESNPNRFKKPEGIRFLLNEDDLKETFKLSTILGTPHIVFEAKNDKIFLGTENCEVPTTDTAYNEVGTSQNKFKISLDKANFRIFKGTYDVTVSKKGFIFLELVESEFKLEYYISFNQKFSKFEDTI